ncbi:MAG TPA: glycosyltransferase family 4 protein [Candidatus Angelobacter sp.]|nr:glycosyltransferase family 4 protein [Candidatus Angelobacter sp.]
MTILSVAYALAPVAPGAVGGAEQVLSRLDAELTRAGHQSIVVACEGSQVSGRLLAVPRPEGDFDETARRMAAWRHRDAIVRALENWPVDAIHLHGVDFLNYLPARDLPMLATLHLPISWYPRAVFQLGRPQLFFNCVSASQHRNCAPCANLLPPIENGVPEEFFSARHAKRRFALALGRICPEKGFHIALDAAAQAGVRMLIAGQVFPYADHKKYFEEKIAPRLNASARFIGPVRPPRTKRLLAAARCLLVPSLAPETSSLVAMEALACGTPVIAFRSGALAELVEPGRTGFLVSSREEMAEAIRQADSIDPEVCRRTARERFSVKQMARRYFDVYRRLAGSKANPFNRHDYGAFAVARGGTSPECRMSVGS